jgi:hypothetical protein
MPPAEAIPVGERAPLTQEFAVHNPAARTALVPAGGSSTLRS